MISCKALLFDHPGERNFKKPVVTDSDKYFNSDEDFCPSCPNNHVTDNSLFKCYSHPYNKTT